MALEMLPKSFNGIVIRAVWRQVYGADMMPMEIFGFMPTGIIQHQIDLLFSGWHFLRHGVEKSLKCLGVIVRLDQANQLPIIRIDCPHNVLANVPTIITLRRPTTSFDPSLSRTGIAFKSCFITKEETYVRIFGELE